MEKAIIMEGIEYNHPKGSVERSVKLLPLIFVFIVVFLAMFFIVLFIKGHFSSDLLVTTIILVGLALGLPFLARWLTEHVSYPSIKINTNRLIYFRKYRVDRMIWKTDYYNILWKDVKSVFLDFEDVIIKTSHKEQKLYIGYASISYNREIKKAVKQFAKTNTIAVSEARANV